MQIDMESKGKEVVPPNEQKKGKDVVLPSERVTVEVLNGRVTLDQGWATFAVVRHIKIGFMVTFKLLTPNMQKVIMFNDDGIEVVTRCRKHDGAFAMNP
ncbi:Pentatricopeptide repeat-containing protein [Hordeum vulgare]|nr:Pentatricopeptide repeat-containing protein [Hordeum vulgare]